MFENNYDIAAISKYVEMFLTHNFPGLRIFNPIYFFVRHSKNIKSDRLEDFFQQLINDYFEYEFSTFYFHLYDFLKSDKVHFFFAINDIKKIEKLIMLFESKGIDFKFLLTTGKPSSFKYALYSNVEIPENPTINFYNLLPFFGVEPEYYQTKEIFQKNYKIYKDPSFEKEIFDWFFNNFDFDEKLLISHLNNVKRDVIRHLKKSIYL